MSDQPSRMQVSQQTSRHIQTSTRQEFRKPKSVSVPIINNSRVCVLSRQSRKKTQKRPIAITDDLLAESGLLIDAINQCHIQPPSLKYNIITATPSKMDTSQQRRQSRSVTHPFVSPVLVSPHSEMPRNHLVLDIDGTLIDANSTDQHIGARPGLAQFLDDCFKQFATVSIWTAAKPEWFQLVWKQVLKPLVEDRGHAFHFVWTQETCTSRAYVGSKGMLPKGNQIWYDLVKPLRRVWKMIPECTRYNVFIIDDNETTFVDNPHNAVHIPAYEGSRDDNALTVLRAWLPQAATTSNVRVLNKPWVVPSS